MFHQVAPHSKVVIARFCGVVLAAAGLLGAGQALAQTAAAASDVRVHQGVSAAAPSGFLDFCRRAPSQCRDAAAPATTEEDARIRARAASLYWNAAFAPSAADHAATSMERVVDRQDDRALSARRQASAASDRVPAASDAGAFSVEDAAVGTDAVATGVAAVAVLNKAQWKQVSEVNTSVNRQIRRASDVRAHAQVDYWADIKTPNGLGDCEDYVLTKRRALVEAGVPSDTLSIAIVETPWNELHAVLIVAADDGDYVLDNLSPWVKRWNETGYRFIERQSPGRPLNWVSAR